MESDGYTIQGMDWREYHRQVTDKIDGTVDWATPGLQITRLRLISDIGWPTWDVSYCVGRIGERIVRVALPFDTLRKGSGLKKAIITFAKKDNVFAKGLGILDNISCFQG